jgi:hypothetical protein
VATVGSLPGDVQIVIEQLDDADRRADALVANLSDTQFHWQPDGGKRWSVAQCLEHLATADAVYGVLMREAIDRARQAGSTRRGPFAPGFFGRQFAKSLEPPVRFRGRAPSKIVPGSSLSRDEILRRYHATHAELKTMAQDAAAIDANAATFQNPFLTWVRVKVSTAFRIINAHNRRHLWQAERVLMLPDFPRSR